MAEKPPVDLSWVTTTADDPDEQRRRRRAQQVYAAVVVFVTLVVAAVGNWAYIQHVDHQAEQRNVERAREICGLIVVLDEAYQATPPTTQLGRNVADEIHAYRTRLGC